MTPLLQQFLSEARDFLQGIGEKLIQLEKAAKDPLLMSELFRLVHTLKGNCGLFDFPEMQRVLHAAEDLMVVVRAGELAYDQHCADSLLDAMDFISILLDEIEQETSNPASHAATSVSLAQSLRALLPAQTANNQQHTVDLDFDTALPQISTLDMQAVPEALRMTAYRTLVSPAALGSEPAADGVLERALFWITYTPEAECFFKGEDPFFLARQVPALQWQKISARATWTDLAELDAYQCNLRIQLISAASRSQLAEHFRYVPEQISLCALTPALLILPVGERNGGPVYEDFVLAALAQLQARDLAALSRSANSMLELSSAALCMASALRWLLLVIELEPENLTSMGDLLQSLRAPNGEISHTVLATPIPLPTAPLAEAPADTAAAIAAAIIAAQALLLGLPDQVTWLPGRLISTATTLKHCFSSLGQHALLAEIDAALAEALAQSTSSPLRDWLSAHQDLAAAPRRAGSSDTSDTKTTPCAIAATANSSTASGDGELKFGRRAEDGSARTLKVDQEKIDRLMNLIGEMVVAKNALPYLASRAETVFGVRDLAREIKAQYAVINRIAEEMQGTIMQVRMLPVSFVFQRFPRLVRDISRKLGKEISLLLEGEDTEADKNIIEALADPLIHIIRNSLDHGFETPEARRQLGKPAQGRLLISASQEAGRVIIDISDDGKGIDPLIIKTKAFEKGLIDEARFDRISDHEAINLIFAAGFSTAEVVSDLSGRGVGMDVVRTAVEQVNGSVTLSSQVGQGTQLRLSLPLSIAVTNVMIIESNQQIFGIPMEMVVETVRIPRAAIHTIKASQTAILRGRLVPLCSLNELLASDAPQIANESDELATLVIRLRGEHIGILIDDFRGVVDIILKPMGGILGSLSSYSGSALLGDGSVLMVLNLKEML
ncbi:MULTISPECIES: chemotaxis protein CheA [unclassified Undibacterium]|uniref:chemotaxis protein CheA n=1 Tax=unclassified Undibacterium TaxID=2630295 RepID=UPI002AC9DB21|nr:MULTISPECIES: chemotaxis protein CheA [unclassified Undibacterium]MEB0140157.1 chemotaxis protein CheA [Undibacterium sp. CCC2.1]MEB0172469.1 chemotaxis protein CheA [Undibacterium sp. CCC1.1]MEB0176987.1 chemotaxis protein CheA [Undibacterium sp. CCC3.4]MEB0215591.1 chemotaxis protein CheA [Undibacterium sp. 5I2]WPX43702.1 chemotaxis protein CheA [Undibacterium sp. CCC3.4]